MLKKSVLLLLLKESDRMREAEYPSSVGVNRTIVLKCCVLIEVLWYREAHENREPQDEFSSKAV